MPDPLIVAGLYSYAVKSLAGVPLQTAAIGPRGFLYDRERMVVGPDGVFITQRQCPRMALHTAAVTADGVLTLRRPDGGSISVPAGNGLDRDRIPVTVWKDTVPAVDEGPEAAEWLTEALGRECKLVRFPPGHIRRSRQGEGQIGFPDQAPFLVISQGSLDDLNRRLGSSGAKEIPMDRFRPNIVVTGCKPYAEGDWLSIRIGDVVLIASHPCTRCEITTIDQATGELTGKEPLRTLATYRRSPKGVIFGHYYNHATVGTIQAGWEMEVK